MFSDFSHLSPSVLLFVPQKSGGKNADGRAIDWSPLGNKGHKRKSEWKEVANREDQHSLHVLRGALHGFPVFMDYFSFD